MLHFWRNRRHIDGCRGLAAGVCSPSGDGLRIACYPSGAYGLWKPPLAVGLGEIGCFFYFFMVKALNADIDARYVELINTTDGSFMTPKEAKHLMLCGSALLVGKK